MIPITAGLSRFNIFPLQLSVNIERVIVILNQYTKVLIINEQMKNYDDNK